MSGIKYGRLEVLSEGPRKVTKSRPSGFRKLICRCECGTVGLFYLDSLKSGRTTSCGCYKREHNRTHGYSKRHPIYNAWNHIIQRCDNPKTKYYHRYGGRGITYDVNRRKFENFLLDMGEGREKGLSIDRIDNNGNYSKENCRWANHKQQSRNRSNNISYCGLLKTEWIEIAPNSRLVIRIKRSEIKRVLKEA